MDDNSQIQSLASKKKMKNLFSGELHNLESYIKRLFYVILKIKKNINNKDELMIHLKKMDHQFVCLFEEFIGESDGQIDQDQFCIEELEQKLLHGINFLRSLLWLKNDIAHSQEKIRTIINSCYQFCYEFHQIIDPENSMKIQLPRTLMITISAQQEAHSIPKFFLSKEKILTLMDSPCEYKHLGDMRNKKHDEYLRQGHQYIYHKNYARALEVFTKASKIKITSQCLNLIGWTYSLQGNLAKAKDFCLQAIRQDPHLGDPYNDMGSYLMVEGKLKECLEWFNKAKKAKHYVNREFPYINAGKAYLMDKNYEKALNEFSAALDYVPYQQELVKTIKKLRNMISRKQRRTDLPADLPDDLELQ